MKAIAYIIAIAIALGAAFFSFSHSSKFAELEKKHLSAMTAAQEVNAKLAAAEKNIKDEKALTVAAEDKLETAKQNISSIKTAGATYSTQATKLDAQLVQQASEQVLLDKTLEDVKSSLQGLGTDVTMDNLAEKIVEIDEGIKTKKTKLEELETLTAGAEKLLTSNRAEAGRLATRYVERNARIRRNATQAVVTAVNQEWGFLVIGAGSNSGFSPQTSLLVQRDGVKIGRVKPSSIEPNQVIAEIDLDSLATGVRIQPGDQVLLATPAAN
jgi:hypothetical protein